MKWIMLAYFGISLFIIIMSTIKVASGSIPSMNYLRFLLMIPLTGEMPQLIEFTNIIPWVTHLSYRFYSMMMTTTFLGFLLALIYKPRTWCTICPIATVSEAYINKSNKD
jgi:polyferredoxin